MLSRIRVSEGIRSRYLNCRVQEAKYKASGVRLFITSALVTEKKAEKIFFQTIDKGYVERGSPAISYNEEYDSIEIYDLDMEFNSIKNTHINVIQIVDEIYIYTILATHLWLS